MGFWREAAGAGKEEWGTVWILSPHLSLGAISPKERRERMVGEQPQSRDYCPGTSFSGRRVRIPAGRWSGGLAPAPF